MKHRTRELTDPDVVEFLAAAGFVSCPTTRHALWEHLVELAEQERRQSTETEAPAIEEAA